MDIAKFLFGLFVGVLCFILLLIMGVTLHINPAPDTERALSQHTQILNGIIEYIKEIQDRKLLPTPEELAVKEKDKK